MKCDTDAARRRPASRWPDERLLTVTNRYQRYARVPEIRMVGQWLARAGFTGGCRLAIVVTPGSLVITIAEPPPPLEDRRRSK